MFIRIGGAKFSFGFSHRFDFYVLKIFLKKLIIFNVLILF
jgi:hypothetical protein